MNYVTKILMLKKLVDSIHHELHIGAKDENEILRIVCALDRLNYDVIALVNYSRKMIDRIYSKIDTNILILSKMFIHDRELEKLKYWRNYDIVAVKPSNRFRINKLIRVYEIDLLTIDFSTTDQIPSKDQVKILTEESKGIEIVLHDIDYKSFKKLKLMYRFLNDVLNIDNVVIIPSIGIYTIYDIKNPVDKYSIFQVLFDYSDKDIREMKERVLKFLIDCLYRKGVELYG